MICFSDSKQQKASKLGQFERFLVQRELAQWRGCTPTAPRQAPLLPEEHNDRHVTASRKNLSLCSKLLKKNIWVRSMGLSTYYVSQFRGFSDPPSPLVINCQHFPNPLSPLVIFHQHLPDPLSHYKPLNSSKNTSWHEISMDWDVFCLGFT